MKKLESKKGITLIALIITIIVMLILVGVSVTVALNGGLFSQAKMAKDRTLNERNNELARDNGEVIINGKVYASIADYLAGKEKGEADDEGTGEVIANAVYQTVDGTIYLIYEEEITLEDGTIVESLPALQTGDTYTQGDYEYKYNQSYFYIVDMGAYWMNDRKLQNGWGARVTDRTKESYGEMLSTILGADVHNLQYIYTGCTNLKIAPLFSENTKIADYAFQGCTSLESFRDGFSIPDGVESINYMFHDCTALASLPTGFTIPGSATDAMGMFWLCTALSSLPTGFTIPDGVSSISSMFSGCTALASLPTGFTIPDSVSDLNHMFSGCTALASLPTGFTIPSGVEEMYCTFENCKLLTGTIVIDATDLYYDEEEEDYGWDSCFAGTEQEIILTTTVEGEEQIELLKAIAATGNGNVKVNE